jgi:hypothetical protein
LDNDLAGAIESGSREEAARALAPVVAGMLERRTGSRANALQALPAAVKAVLSARRRLKGGAFRAGTLSILKEKAPGSPADGAREGLGRSADGAIAARSLLAGEAEGLEELVLVVVEGLSFREAGLVTGAPAAMVERRASVAFARIAEALGSG